MAMRIGMLISGGGTTAAAIVKACKEGALHNIAEPALLVSSRRNAPGLQRVLDAGMDKENIVIIRPRDFSSPARFGEAIIRHAKERGVDFLGQYGWLPQTPINVIEHWKGMMANQHPGPLDPGWPDFGGQSMYGLRVHSARIYFVRATGHDLFTEATAQRVHQEYDRGAVIARQAVQISYFPRETAHTLAAKLLPVEHALHIGVIRQFALGKAEECVRANRLVYPHEVPILEEAKRVAKTLYPRG